MKFVFTTLARLAGIAAGIASANGSRTPRACCTAGTASARATAFAVAFGMPKSTIVAAVRVRDGHVLRSEGHPG